MEDVRRERRGAGEWREEKGKGRRGMEGGNSREMDYLEGRRKWKVRYQNRGKKWTDGKRNCKERSKVDVKERDVTGLKEGKRERKGDKNEGEERRKER